MAIDLRGKMHSRRFELLRLSPWELETHSLTSSDKSAVISPPRLELGSNAWQAFILPLDQGELKCHFRVSITMPPDLQSDALPNELKRQSWFPVRESNPGLRRERAKSLPLDQRGRCTLGDSNSCGLRHGNLRPTP